MSVMQPLLPRELLALWDEGAARHPLDRAALLCARARSDLPSDAIVDLPLGEVTRSVLRLREASFGERIESHVDCPACGARLAVSVLISQVLPPQLPVQLAVQVPVEVLVQSGPQLTPHLPPEPAVHPFARSPVQSPVQLAGGAGPKAAPPPGDGSLPGTVPDSNDARSSDPPPRDPPLAGLRAPTLRDLAAVAQVADAEEGARLLLARCLRDDAAAAAFAGADLATIEAAFEALDPYADLDLSVTCTDCGKPASVTLDAAVVLWDEIDAHARALLRTVHAIAAVYGWTEDEILDLGPARRDAYVAMVSS